MALLHVPDFFKFARWREFTVLQSQHFRLTILDNKCMDMCTSRSISFGLTLDGKVLDVIEEQDPLGQTSVFNFSTEHVWNGWFFETRPALDAPTRFALYNQVGDEWRQVGSSSFMQAADNTIFLKGYFTPSKGRNHFRLSYPGVCGYWLCRISCCLGNAGLVVAAITGTRPFGRGILLSFILYSLYGPSARRGV